MPSRQVRQSVLCNAQRVVIKLGSALLAGERFSLNIDLMESIATQVADLRARGVEVTLVSSGAVGVGRHSLALSARPTDIGELQAVAAVGQSGLMQLWHTAFVRHETHVAQMLLTRSDFDDRQRYLNIRNCLAELHRFGAIPIVNENDTVAVDEIRFGDNDVLAAMVANAVRADVLILLTSVDGLLNAEGERVDLVEDVYEARQWVRRDRTSLGTGGMTTKLEAARRVSEAGEVTVIANGRTPNIVSRLLQGEQLGTVFLPAPRKLDSRQRWIGMTAHPAGSITIDDGAAQALLTQGKSLLAVGITQVTGMFDRGDVVIVHAGSGVEVARGLVNYTADETRKIMGQRSDRFEQLLGHSAYDEVIHRDNMLIASRGMQE